MSTPRVSVTKAEHLVPGAVYRVRGTAGGKDIPPQAVRVESSPEFRSIVDPGGAGQAYPSRDTVSG